MADVTERSAARLETWSQIAGYLGVTARCAQRWEAEEGLPIRRNGNRVYAWEQELAAWRQARESGPGLPPQPTPSVLRRLFQRRYVVWAIVLGVAGFATLIGSRFHVGPAISSPAVRSPAGGRFLWKATAEGGSFTRVPLPEEPSEVAVSPDGQTVYVIPNSRPVLMIIDSRSLQVHTVPLIETVRSITVSPDGSSVYLGSASAGVVDFDPASRRIKRIIPTEGPVSDIAVTPDGRKLFLAMKHNGVRRFNIESATWRQLTFQGCPHFVDVDESGKLLVVSYQCGGPGGRDGHDGVEIFDVATESRAALFSGPPLVGGRHRFLPGGELLWLDGLDACVTQIYDHKGCSSVPSRISYLFRHSDRSIVSTLALREDAGGRPNLLHDGTRVFLAEGVLLQIDIRNYDFVESYKLDDPYVNSDVVSADGKRVTLRGLVRRIWWCFPRNRRSALQQVEAWFISSRPTARQRTLSKIFRFTRRPSFGADSSARRFYSEIRASRESGGLPIFKRASRAGRSRQSSKPRAQGRFSTPATQTTTGGPSSGLPAANSASASADKR
jgi:hypothetical protein